MKICIPSIRHSGTRLLMKKIFKGWKAANPLDPRFKAGNYMIAGHVYPPSLDYMIGYMENYPIVVPLRHPSRVWKSFADRDMSYDFFCDHWYNMIKFVDILSPNYIHIDVIDRRDDDLLKVEQKFGIELQHDWTIDDTVCDKGNATMNITHKDTIKMPNFILDFYERTL